MLLIELTLAIDKADGRYQGHVPLNELPQLVIDVLGSGNIRPNDYLLIANAGASSQGPHLKVFGASSHPDIHRILEPLRQYMSISIHPQTSEILVRIS